MPKFYEEHTYEDALKVIKKQVRHWEKGESFEYHLQPFKTAVKALEKQIPRKLKAPSDPFDTVEECPCCGENFGLYGIRNNERSKFCANCGQALDWEVNDVGDV